MAGRPAIPQPVTLLDKDIGKAAGTFLGKLRSITVKQLLDMDARKMAARHGLREDWVDFSRLYELYLRGVKLPAKE